MSSLRIVVLALALALIPAIGLASRDGTGTLRGTVRDADNGDRLPGASLLLVGTTTGCSTDLDGEYEVEGIPPGAYEVRVSSMGYATETLPGVVIEAGKTEKLDVRLARQQGAASYTIDDLVVTADRVLSTDVALITERMKSITIGDGISAERISKSPDGTGSDVLKRVTGLSVLDDKFLYVRGMTDRYSTTWIDGVTTSSTDTDVDRRSFTFDVLPASLLSSAVIVKTATPDLPGDFTGGLVQLNTKDIPHERIFKVSASQGWEGGVIGRSMLRTIGGDTDWLGIDDGTRDLPDVEPSGGNYNDIATALPNTWVTRTEKAPPNGSYDLTYGDRIDIGDNDGEHLLGVIAGIKYSGSYDVTDFTETSDGTGGTELYDREGSRHSYKVLWSGLASLSYAPSPRQQYTARAMYVRDSRDQVTLAEGNITENSGPGGQKHVIEWDERTRYTTQLTGRYEFGRRRGPELEWKLFRSNATAEEPDRKHADFLLRADGTHSLGENSRSWSDLDERAGGARADLTIPLGLSKAKIGVYIEQRRREYSTDAYYTYTGNVRPPYTYIRVLPIEEIFLPDNYGRKKLAFKMKAAYTGEYEGTHEIEAYYAMIDHPFSLGPLALRIAGGARLEHSLQDVASLRKEGDEEPVYTSVNKVDVLPSASLTYSPTDWANVRLAVYHSVNRPELRELADVKYYDFNEDSTVQGNPKLRRALVKNYDLRIEAFPGANEVLAASYFYKDIYNAIELTATPSTDYKLLRSWFNSPEGHNHGFEVEAKKTLGFVAGFLDGFTLVGNYTRVYSEVEWRYEGEKGTRPLQGQAPWAVNLALVFEDQNLGTSVSLLYNKIGRRIETLGATSLSHRWLEPRDMLDLAATQRLFGSVRFKFTAKNILRSEEVTTLGEDGLSPWTESGEASYSLSAGVSF